MFPFIVISIIVMMIVVIAWPFIAGMQMNDHTEKRLKDTTKELRKTTTELADLRREHARTVQHLARYQKRHGDL